MIHPWDRQKGETAKAFAAFQAYLDLGSERGLEGAGRKIGKCKAVLERWSLRWDWVNRTREFDLHNAKIQQEAVEKVLRASAAKWAHRLAAQREEEFEIAEQFLEKCRQGLKFPLASSRREVDEVGPDGRIVKVTVVEPARWTLDTLAKFGELAVKLKRTSLGLATDRHEHVGQDGHPLPAANTSVVIFLPDNGRDRPEEAPSVEIPRPPEPPMPAGPE